MAETCAIGFSYPTSYSTSIPIGGLSALLLPFLMWAGPDFENFAQNGQSSVFAFFPQYLIAVYRKSRKARETIFGSLIAGLVLYWYSSKYLLCSIYYADRWHCSFADRKTAMKHVQGGKVWAFLLPASRIVTPSKLKLCPWCTSSKKSFHFPLRDTFSSWEITRWIV